MAKRNAVTQSEIAQALGLTQMTVSRALNGSDLLAADTRERILAKATAMGYRPNGLARRVQERRYRGMALLGSLAPGYRNIYEPEFHVAVGTKLSTRNWHLTQGWLPAEGLGDPQMVQSLLDRMLADAVLIHDVGPQKAEAEELLLHYHITRVWINSGRRWDGVDFSDADGAAIAVRHLLAQGYRRPALAIPHLPKADDHISLHERVRGFSDACRDLGLTPTLLHPGDGLPDSARNGALRQGLSGDDRPDAVICYNPEIALLIRIIAAERGWRLGQDLGLVSIGSADSTDLDVPITTVVLDYETLGSEAVMMAWRIMETGKRQPQVRLPASIIRSGASTTRS